ncbi:MAG: proteic killer suppression protein [Halioglobus sp.]|jgi:proteic killer suppression protein
MPINSFKNPDIQLFFETGQTVAAGWQPIEKVAQRKLDMLNYAHSIQDLRSPPGNRLEKLRGSLEGFYSVRINDQWRIIFEWGESGPQNVDIVDYH